MQTPGHKGKWQEDDGEAGNPKLPISVRVKEQTDRDRGCRQAAERGSQDDGCLVGEAGGLFLFWGRNGFLVVPGLGPRLRGGLEAVALHAAVERGTAEAEFFGGFVGFAFAAGEGAANEIGFDFFEAHVVEVVAAGRGAAGS